jgi:two-component sensor histidine kinase
MAGRIILHPDAGLRLALAVVAASSEPLLLLDADLTLIAASASFCEAFGFAAADIEGRELYELAAGRWNVPGLRLLLEQTNAGAIQVAPDEISLRGDDNGVRRLVLHARKLDYDDPGHVRILLTVTDVTDARSSVKRSDDALLDKAVRLREVEHRVANSLQIIASILMLNMRSAGSPETRGPLREAYQRLISVGALQKQLAATATGNVEVRAYLNDLCRNIAASMIDDDNHVCLRVTADDSIASAEDSVSLGLIATELVINAVKHAFSRERGGTIDVGYRGMGATWALSVSDNGIGRSTAPGGVKPGLGVGIVTALATQLDARVRIVDGHPGTVVSIIHDGNAAQKAPGFK